ncbi:MAG: hypothetical protein JWM42_3842 [Burkholderia sp.]|nr:hypothetical protein [Burkholderia sp.]
MFTNPITANTQANLAKQMLAYIALVQSAFEGGAKILELNLSVSKARFDQSSAALNQLLSGKPQDFYPLLARQARQDVESALVHSARVSLLVTNSHAEFAKNMQAKVQLVTETDITARKNGTTGNG